MKKLRIQKSKRLKNPIQWQHRRVFRNFLTILVLSVLTGLQLFAHSGKPKYHVVIDTDGALDDMRSISMFLSGHDIRVLSVTCSQGTLLPDSVYSKVKSLLSVFHHEGIRVGIGDETGYELPVWSSFAQGISWGSLPEKQFVGNREKAGSVLTKTIANYPEKITFIALGSLKTYADWITANPKAAERIDKIIWYNNAVIEKGFNYKASPESYHLIRETGVELVVVSSNPDKFIIDDNYLESIKNTNSQYAGQIRLVHEQPAIKERINQKHLRFWDDMIPLFLTVPLLFESEVKNNIRFVQLNSNMPPPFVYEIVGDLLESSTTAENQVFSSFPVDTALYKPAYAKILKSTINKFGLVEWKAICLTNEIHGHTGIYSIIGAKMGIRAMEYFNVGVNNLYVTSFAGLKPPLSCLNDGIQISAGTTIGQGLITVSDSVLKIPTAIVEFNNRKIKISLKKEIAERMQQDIKHAISTYGLLTENYWFYIEKLALQYWSEYDKYEIFTIEKV